MSANFTKEANIFGVHGVHADTNANDCQHRKLSNKNLFGSHIKRGYAAFNYPYEDINDNVQGIYKTIISSISNTLKKAINLLGNVVITTNNSSTAGKTRSGQHEKSLDPCSNDCPLIFGVHTEIMASTEVYADELPIRI